MKESRYFIVFYSGQKGQGQVNGWHVVSVSADSYLNADKFQKEVCHKYENDFILITNFIEVNKKEAYEFTKGSGEILHL